jgi:hypothetical protein
MTGTARDLTVPGRFRLCANDVSKDMSRAEIGCGGNRRRAMMLIKSPSLAPLEDEILNH